jgi:Holliday junction resolvase RusA-like endonuclease
MEFFLSCVPPKATHHAKKIVRVGKFSRLADNDKLVIAKETIDTLLLAHRPPHPMRGPTVLALEFTWPWRLKDKAGARARGRIPCDVRPDCSNLAKTTEDRLVALRFLEDDGQVVALLVRKWFGEPAGILVRMRPYAPHDRDRDQPHDDLSLFAGLEG